MIILKRSFFDKAAESCGVPKETVMDLTKLSFAENKELYVENHKGICEFSNTVIRIKTRFSIIKITGADFKISHINKYDLLIEGVFSDIVFEH